MANFVRNAEVLETLARYMGCVKDSKVVPVAEQHAGHTRGGIWLWPHHNSKLLRN
jgi:hypothetical protein